MAQTPNGDIVSADFLAAITDHGYDMSAVKAWLKETYNVEQVDQAKKSMKGEQSRAKVLSAFLAAHPKRMGFDQWTEEAAPPATVTADEKAHAITLSQPAAVAPDAGPQWPPSIFNIWQETELDKRLDPNTVKQRDGRGNQKFDYLDGSTIFETANRIFGYGMWGYEPVGDYTYREIGAGKLYVGIFVKVWVMGPDGQRSESTDRGSGETTANNAAELEKAEKGAITDGVKRGLVRFGTMFGNDLRG